MSTNGQYPARVERFHDLEVLVHEINGENYITAEDLGKCLGLAEPRIAVNKIFRRNRDELELYSIETKLVSNAPGAPMRLFSEKGCNLISMFAKSKTAKKVRLWLASLPKQHRQRQEQVQEVLPQVVRQTFEKGQQEGFKLGRRHGVSLALRLLDCPAVARLGLDGVSELVWARQRGDTQAEAGERLGISQDTVQEVEKALKELGIYFPAVNGMRRKKEMRLALAFALGEPSPALLPPGGKGAGEQLPAPERDS